MLNKLCHYKNTDKGWYNIKGHIMNVGHLNQKDRNLSSLTVIVTCVYTIL